MSRTVLITGASRGIGRAALIELSRRGYNVIGVCRNNRKKLEKAIEEANSFGVMALAVPDINVGDYDQCKKGIYEYIHSQGMSVDCIVNNAGISHVGLLQDMSPDEWNNIISVNLGSVFNICSLFIPDMIKKSSGKIINISSVWGNAGASCEVAYSASKGGINSFTRALAKELAPSGIQVNAIAFGAIDTEMNNHLSQEERLMLEGEIPMGRMGMVEEAAKLIADTIEMPEYLTGQIITMDGGWI